MILALLLILGATLYPYTVWDGSLVAAYSVVPVGVAPEPQEILLNVLLFVPFGMACMKFVRVPRSKVGRVLATIILSGLLSASVEAVQLMIPSRLPSAQDIIANVLGGLIGSCCWAGWSETFSSGGRRIKKQWAAFQERFPAGFVLAVYILLVLTSCWFLQGEARPSNWDGDYPLLLGNEATQDRPWVGRILQLELVPLALAPRSTLPALKAELNAILPRAEVKSYAFAANLPNEFIRRGTPRYEHDVHLGQLVDANAWLESRAAGRAFNRQVKREGQFTIRLVCAPSSRQQAGPARILSLSVDPFHRNLTIGQQKDALVVRLRTPATGLNGSNPEIAIPGIFSRPEQRTVVVSFDGQTLTVAADGDEKQRYSFRISPGTVLVSRVQRLAAQDLMGPPLLFLSSILVPAGWLFAVGAQRLALSRMHAALLLGLCGLVCAVAVQATIAASSGGFFRLLDVLIGWSCTVLGGWGALTNRPSLTDK